MCVVRVYVARFFFLNFLFNSTTTNTNKFIELGGVPLILTRATNQNVDALHESEGKDPRVMYEASRLLCRLMANGENPPIFSFFLFPFCLFLFFNFYILYIYFCANINYRGNSKKYRRSSCNTISYFADLQVCHASVRGCSSFVNFAFQR